MIKSIVQGVFVFIAAGRGGWSFREHVWSWRPANEFCAGSSGRGVFAGNWNDHAAGNALSVLNKAR
jgi:hypothetical protein